ncbi:MAG TPA: hypothetical protein VGK27_06710 [Candidatus Deferrimicrobiaceae bacterium]|jgi:hypothetical protein
MGIVLKSVLFLLRRGPEIYETGKLLRSSLGAQGPALPAGTGEIEVGSAGDRIRAIEHEMRLVREEREQLAVEVEQLSKEVAALRPKVERAEKRLTVLTALFAAFIAVGLFLAGVVLARFP